MESACNADIHVSHMESACNSDHVLYVQASVIDPTAYHEISITIYGDMK